MNSNPVTRLTWFALSSILLLAWPTQAAFTIARRGNAQCVIIQQPEATLAESNAVRELATTLERATGARFQIQQSRGVMVPEHAIIVGPGETAQALFPEARLDDLGAEEFVMRLKGGRLLLAGGRPRGTLYAVYHFLQDQCGVRWWAPGATTIPSRPNLRIQTLNVRGRPAFEYREPYWFTAFDPLWKVRNGANGESHVIPDAWGGCIKYKGFCHTFYALVPPDKYFATHPEWYSLINGKRTHDNAQLCLSNPELRDFVVQRVKEWLREAPDAKIISVTQNDCQGACQCPICQAIDQDEGSPSGSMLAFVNYIAEKIEPEFPDVWVDTFAYQYTRKPPRHIRPRHNVIVRLCSIECNFREPLDDPSNAAFLSDLTRWSEICPHLYVWDYVTDFAHYVLPHPNWFTLGPNIRIFQHYGVKGVFEEGAYAGPGAEMSELRAWVLAQLLWNPQQNDRALIREFLRGYYGNRAGDYIERYLQEMYDASQGFNLRCYLGKDPPHLRFQPLSAAELLWQEAESAARHDPDPDKVLRVRMGRLPIWYACLGRWASLRRECWEQNANWPWPASRKALADEFRTVCAGVPGKDWTCVQVLNEGGLTVDKFLKPLESDVPDTNGPPPPKRIAHAHPPSDLRGLPLGKCVDLQDNVASLYAPGTYSQIRPDLAASDRRAVWMPDTHHEWAFRISGASLPRLARSGHWRVYVVVRVEKKSGKSTAAADALAFTAGVYDNQTRSSVAEFKAPLRDTTDTYRSYLVGTVELSPARDIWVAPAGNAAAQAIYVDRVFLAPQ